MTAQRELVNFIEFPLVYVGDEELLLASGRVRRSSTPLYEDRLLALARRVVFPNRVPYEVDELRTAFARRMGLFDDTVFS